MLSTLVYRSRLRGEITTEQLAALDRQARADNEARGITGILLFDGSHCFQLLEGPEAMVQEVYRRVCADLRHHHVVKLLDDYAPGRKFGQWGMKLFDVRAQPPEQADALVRRLVQDTALPAADRAFKLIRAFASGRWRDHAVAVPDAASWTFERRPTPFRDAGPQVYSSTACQFALQPIVDASTGQVSSLEALIRSASGGPPQECFDRIPRDQLHRFDLESKRQAFELAAAVGIGACRLSINLLPASLVDMPHAVDHLVEQIRALGLAPQQVIVEITEEEALSHFGAFQAAIKRLRAAGIGLAIDDFGAGFAGLSLLSKFQPEKLKIDRMIVTGIHADGPRQAIVKAVVECCRSLGITTVAEGVETFDEWCWLRAAGVDLFQGFLVAKPRLNGVADVVWPVPRRGAAATAALTP
ncbi:diguanylate phosphodiesterase [Xylophilus sp.]|uniref:diguanylate phosphodiesterase n=1 Tax=Xylophilus sp. TaxID=2653893 RepID=UPI0013BA8A0A|nr:diguanylate phosphodiesterase [Xylophilus sp.]KAF1046609.1 MAG: Blue light- and temperature-regulated antirepressor BluF [Xylophilus sp.]